MSLPYAAKGYRFLRVGEDIRRGDFMPDGIDWVPVSESLIGTHVFGARWSGGEEGEGELIARPRLRCVSKVQRERILAMRAINA